MIESITIPGFKKIDKFFLILFFLSFFHPILGLLFNIVLIYYWKWGVEGCLKSLLFLTIRGILNPALAAVASVQSIRWLIFLGASILILLYGKIDEKDNKHNKYNLIVLSVSGFSCIVIYLGFVTSSYPITAMFKAISFAIVFCAVMKGIAVTIEEVDWSMFFVSFFSILYLINIFLIPFQQFRIVNDNFQGVFNHVNLFGIVSALFFAMLQKSKFYKEHKVMKCLMSIAIFVMVYLSASRTGLLSLIIIFLLYFYSNGSRRFFKTILALSICTIILIFIPEKAEQSLVKNIHEFVYKNDAENIMDSRLDIMENYKIKYELEPLAGTGLMVPYDSEIRDYSLKFDLSVEPGNLIWTLVGDTGIIGTIAFGMFFLTLLCSGKIKNMYILFGAFIVCMGEMVFFSVNNMAVIIYFLIAIYVFDYEKKDNIKVEV